MEEAGVGIKRVIAGMAQAGRAAEEMEGTLQMQTGMTALQIPAEAGVVLPEEPERAVMAGQA